VITLSGTEFFFWGLLLLVVELSIHLRFKPLGIRLTAIEQLLRRDQGEIFDTLGEHSTRLEALEAWRDTQEKKGR
jgi:hypothetical protein